MKPNRYTIKGTRPERRRKGLKTSDSSKVAQHYPTSQKDSLDDFSYHADHFLNSLPDEYWQQFVEKGKP